MALRGGSLSRSLIAAVRTFSSHTSPPSFFHILRPTSPSYITIESRACCELSQVAMQRSGRSWYSSTSESDNDERLDDNDSPKNNAVDEEVDAFLGHHQPDLQLQGVDPKRGWNFRGVHKAIICGKVGQTPVQKILRNGKNVTIFTVGTGGMFDQRTVGAKDMPKPAQWHRIAVHNEVLGTYAVQQLVKNSSVYVEGDIEIRIYNDAINGEIKSIPEICVRQDGKIRLIRSGESLSQISLDDLAKTL